MNVYKLIDELVCYGVKNGLVEVDDQIYVKNRLLEVFEEISYVKSDFTGEPRPVHVILEELMAIALERDIMQEDTITVKDLFDTKIMGILTPPPSVVRKTFADKYKESPVEATDYYYSFSKATNYIRKDRIAKDEKWIAKTEYGEIDITINLSKPEKDPRDIAKAGKAKATGYPACLLCVENEGYAGNMNHPARQNHRVVPMTLDGDDYFLQYSPYVYYNEHCIIFHKEHIPMTINHQTFRKLLEFVEKFPHYTAGSNADLPIVGGSILSHDHFQGGHYTFAMAKAEYEKTFTIKAWPNVTAGIIKWPMSVIRLQGENRKDVADAADHILRTWRGYTDEAAFIYSETDGTPHNTITPIARMRGDFFELDLVLRNNITTEEHPMGVYHPHAQYHHIKKENIGLIEVLGLAILPARLKKEIAMMEEAIVAGKNLRDDEVLEKHADWVETWLTERDVNKETIHEIMQEEVGKVFVKVLECAGVYKRDENGKEAFERFVKAIQ